MSCNGRHFWMHLWTKPFEVRKGAAWFIEYCKCDGRRHHVINPHNHEPLTEEQPQWKSTP